MKKASFFMISVSALALFASCNKEPEYHYTAIFRPVGLVSGLYADQTVDSIGFTTFDDWELSSTVDWAKPSSSFSCGSVPEGSYAQMVVPVYFEPNATGETRDARFEFKSYGNTYSVYFRQTGYHNIKTPAIVDTLGYSVVQYDIKEASGDIEFTAYSAWTIKLENEDDAAWVVLEGDLRGEAGERKVHYTVAADDDAVARTARILLQGAGVTTPIVITQQQSE